MPWQVWHLALRAVRALSVTAEAELRQAALATLVHSVSTWQLHIQTEDGKSEMDGKAARVAAVAHGFALQTL